MQPEDPKQEFNQPAETSYFSAAPSPAAPDTATTPGSPPANQNEPAVETAEQNQVSQPETAPLPLIEPVHWQAPEYHHQEKNVGWFVAFGAVVVGLTAAAIFLIKSWTFAILIPVMAAALVVYSRRPPRVMDYALSEKGLFVNDTLHSFTEFKGFGVIHDGNEYSVMLIPVRRFQPGISVYFPEQSGEAIVDILGTRLPMQPLQLDAFDKIVRALRL